MVAMNEIRIHPTDERVVDQLKKLIMTHSVLRPLKQLY